MVVKNPVAKNFGGEINSVVKKFGGEKSLVVKIFGGEIHGGENVR